MLWREGKGVRGHANRTAEQLDAKQPFVQSRRLQIRLLVFWPNIPHMSLPPRKEKTIWSGYVTLNATTTHLEFVHYRNDFFFQSLICNLSTTQVDLVPHQDDRNLPVYQ